MFALSMPPTKFLDPGALFIVCADLPLAARDLYVDLIPREVVFRQENGRGLRL